MPPPGNNNKLCVETRKGRRRRSPQVFFDDNNTPWARTTSTTRESDTSTKSKTLPSTIIKKQRINWATNTDVLQKYIDAKQKKQDVIIVGKVMIPSRQTIRDYIQKLDAHKKSTGETITVKKYFEIYSKQNNKKTQNVIPTTTIPTTKKLPNSVNFNGDYGTDTGTDNGTDNGDVDSINLNAIERSSSNDITTNSTGKTSTSTTVTATR